MANTCENVLEIIGDKKEVEAFMKNVLEVEGRGVEYQIPEGDEILPFGWLQNRVEDSIVFDSNWSVPVENIEAMSKLHPTLTFSVTYTIPNDEVAGITVIKNAAYLRDEEDDISSDLARELLGSEYVDSLLDEDICKNYLELEGDKEEITLCMANIFETENNEVTYKVEKNEEETLDLGRLQERRDNAISFDSDYEAPLDNVIEISSLHPELTFTFSYAIPAEEMVSRVKIKDEKILDEEEDDIYSDLAREILGDGYVDEL